MLKKVSRFQAWVTGNDVIKLHSRTEIAIYFLTLAVIYTVKHNHVLYLEIFYIFCPLVLRLSIGYIKLCDWSKDESEFLSYVQFRLEHLVAVSVILLSNLFSASGYLDSVLLPFWIIMKDIRMEPIQEMIREKTRP